MIWKNISSMTVLNFQLSVAIDVVNLLKEVKWRNILILTVPLKSLTVQIKETHFSKSVANLD